MSNWTLASSGVKEVKEVIAPYDRWGVKTIVFLAYFFKQQDIRLNSLTPLTPLTSWYAKVQLLDYSTFANGEVKEFKEVREVKAKCFTAKFSTKKAVGYNF